MREREREGKQDDKGHTERKDYKNNNRETNKNMTEDKPRNPNYDYRRQSTQVKNERISCNRHTGDDCLKQTQMDSR